MIYIRFLTIITLIQVTGTSQSIFDYDLIKYQVNCSIRAIEVIDENAVWFAGSNGMFGYTESGGSKWIIDSISHNSKTKLEFRSIAVTSKAVFILSVGSPTLLFKTVDKGANWQLVYKESHPKAFYNAMTFWDDQYGIAMGDPTDRCLSIILSKDGGDTWKKLSCKDLPPAAEGEAAFAASNSNIALYGNDAWIVTGGTRARVFHSPDRGNSWEAYDTPIIEGGAMTGIFSVDFYDENNGIIIGGDWDNKESNSKNKAITSDGGKTWQLINDGSDPGYRSCVQYVPGTNGNMIFAVGIPGISISKNVGTTWQKVSEESYYTIRVNRSGRSAWLAGKGLIAKITWNNNVPPR